MQPNRCLALVGPWCFGFVLALVPGASGRSARGDDAPPPAITPEVATFFEARVRPVLVERCASCHGAEKQSGGLRVDSRAAMLEGGDLGPSVVPGDPDGSPLIRAVRHQGDNKMPPKGDKLADPAAEALAEWVRMGAPWPVAAAPVASPGTRAEEARRHWSYLPVVDPPLPPVGNPAWVASPVDAFVLSRLEANHLAPSPPADKRTLIRRVSFDLIGLPPTVAEVDAFLADESPEAYGKVVDRLLASPRYGERWGRHWLDVARYADTKGYVFNQEKRYPYSYTYRDYVIGAFNADLPYDRFVTEQVAADRLPRGDDARSLAALGFLTLGRRFLNDQNDIIDDRIDVVTRGLLGLSVTCARCHDHKFDPIPTEDYYSLHGVFASSVEPEELPLLPTPVPEADRLAYEVERQHRLDAAAGAREASRAKVARELRDNLAALVAAAVALDFDPKHPQLDPTARAHGVSPERLRFVAGRAGKLLARAGAPGDPITGPWARFAALPEADFAARAAEVARDLADHPDPAHPVDPAVAALFVAPAEPPPALAEVAIRYGELFERAARSFAPQPAVGPPSETPDPALGASWVRLTTGADALLVLPDDERGDRIFNRLEREQVQKLDTRVAELAASHPGAPARAMVLNDAPHPVTPHVAIRGNPNRPGKEVPRRFLRILTPGGAATPFADGSGRLELARAITRPDNPLTARVLVNRVWHHHFGAGLVTTPSDFGARGEPPTNPALLDFLAARFVAGGWSVKDLHRLILLSATYRQAGASRPDALAADPTNRLLWRFSPRRVDFEALRDGVLAVAGDLDLTMGGRPVELFEGAKTSPRRAVYGYVDRYDLDPTFRTFDFPNPDISAPLRPSTTVPQQALFLLNSPFLLDEAKHLAARPDLAALPDLDARIARLHLDLLGRPAEAHEVTLGRQFIESASLPPAPDAPSAWELYAQVLLMTNEFSTIN